MLFPIRPVGTEVRRPEGVSLRSSTSERRPDAPKVEHDARVTIGADARQRADQGESGQQRAPRASGGGGIEPNSARARSPQPVPDARRGAEQAPDNRAALPIGQTVSSLAVLNEAVPAFSGDQRGEPRADGARSRSTHKADAPLTRGPALPLLNNAPGDNVPYEALQRAASGQNGSVQNGDAVETPLLALGQETEKKVALDGTPIPLASQDTRVFDEAGILPPQRSEQADAQAGLPPAGLGQAGSLQVAGSDIEAVLSINDAVKAVPFDLLRRVVTDAASGSSVAVRATPLFSAPENGGEPFGRAVPFEVVEEEKAQARRALESPSAFAASLPSNGAAQPRPVGFSPGFENGQPVRQPRSSAASSAASPA